MQSAQFSEMLVSDFAEAVEYIEAENAETVRMQYVSASYTAWQMGAGKKKSFGEYLKHLGLSKKEKPMTARQRKQVAVDALKVAQRIAKADKPRGKKKE